jgi:integrase
MPKRARRSNLTEGLVQRLQRKSKHYYFADPGSLGLVLKVPPSPRHPVKYWAVCRVGPKGARKQKWSLVGDTQSHTLDEARDQARVILRRVRSGQPAKETVPQSVAAILAEWLAKVVNAEGNVFKSAGERARIVSKYITPHIGALLVTEVKRSDVVQLLDKIRDDHGPGTASQVKKVLSAAMNWHSKRTDDFDAKAFAGHETSEQERERILTDDEIRALWSVADQHGVAGDFFKFALLTGQRREKIETLRWSDLEGDVWTVRRDSDREKGTAGSLKLPPAVMAIIKKQPQIVGRDVVFGEPHWRTHIALRAAAGLKGVVVHDYRRTFRSLLSRLQISTETSEALMGHQAKGVVKVYDRWHRAPEKAAALGKLAQLVEQIITPAPDNVVKFGGAS